jgi:DNA-binding CsgD family transcriptional regulator
MSQTDSNTNPTERQMILIVRIANGERIGDIAKNEHLSVTSVEKGLKSARKRLGANTLPHLISICIARGLLEWEEEGQVRRIT